MRNKYYCSGCICNHTDGRLDTDKRAEDMIHYIVYVNGKCVGITIHREFAESTAQRMGGQVIEEKW